MNEMEWVEAQNLFIKVREFVAAHPGESKAILLAVAEGMAEYEAVQRDKRDNLADKALLFLIGVLARGRTLPMCSMAELFDAVRHQFPNGVQGHSQVERDLWEAFLNVIQREEAYADSQTFTPTLEWVKVAKGPEALEWWQRVIVPALMEGK